MRLLLDTNVVLDILLNRTEFVSNSLEVVKKAITNGDRLYISSTAATDIYYVIRKQTGKKDVALDGIKKLALLFNFAEVNEKCIVNATVSKMKDFEDAVVDMVASSIEADYIITRNKDDFRNSISRVLTPSEFCLL